MLRFHKAKLVLYSPCKRTRNVLQNFYRRSYIVILNHLCNAVNKLLKKISFHGHFQPIQIPTVSYVEQLPITHPYFDVLSKFDRDGQPVRHSDVDVCLQYLKLYKFFTLNKLFRNVNKVVYLHICCRLLFCWIPNGTR